MGAIEVVTLDAAATVVVDARAAPGGVGAVVRPLFDEVYAVLPRGGLGGDNVILYRSVDGELVLEVGVTTPHGHGELGGRVRPSTLPAGTVARTVHRGPYDGLGAAHDRVVAWCVAEDRARAGCFWERYGDWRQDPAELETEVAHLLTV
jgi:hypothetical protein